MSLDLGLAGFKTLTRTRCLLRIFYSVLFKISMSKKPSSNTQLAAIVPWKESAAGIICWRLKSGGDESSNNYISPPKASFSVCLSTTILRVCLCFLPPFLNQIPRFFPCQLSSNQLWKRTTHTSLGENKLFGACLIHPKFFNAALARPFLPFVSSTFLNK